MSTAIFASLVVVALSQNSTTCELCSEHADLVGLLQVQDTANFSESMTSAELADQFRFNKVWPKSYTGPKKSMHYPLTVNYAHEMKDEGCDAVSFRILSSDPQVWRSMRGKEYCDMNYIESQVLSHQKPYRCTYPDSSSKWDRRQFWEEFEEVLHMQKMRRRGYLVAWNLFQVHPIFHGTNRGPLTMHQAALLVQNDFPTHFPTKLFEYWVNNNKVAFNADVLGGLGCTHGNNEFVNGPVALAKIIGWAVNIVSPAAFAMKWYAGRPRPEEVAWALKSGQLKPSLKNIERGIKSMWLKSPTDFTAYPEGCPKHPAWPAMHSAASSAATYLPVVMNLDAKQLEEARLVDYSVAYFRTCAGVHYPSDNRAGLRLGQHIIKKHLPDFLAENFGCGTDSAHQIRWHAQQRIAEYVDTHDWATYQPPPHHHK